MLPASVRADTGFAAECAAAANDVTLTVGAVDCLRMPSDMVGGVTAFSYFIPVACDPALDRECPVLYFLHGTGGSYNQAVNLGRRGNDRSAWVRALTEGPPVSPYEVDDPWRFGDPDTWVPQPPIDMIITPHGMTVPGGHGPAAGRNSFWFDWNPRYAAGGDSERYSTPPPRFESHLTDELVPYVDRVFPTAGGREQRAINGKSMGGIGALQVGLKHPDIWSSIGSTSGGGAGFPVLAGEDRAAEALPAAVAPPAPVPHVPVPGAVPTLAPEAAWDQLYGSVATVGFGDLAADHVWWRHNQAADLVSNARAWRGDVQSVHVKFHVGDAVPRRTEDLQSSNYATDHGFESILFPNNLVLDDLFGRNGLERDFNIHPGLHGPVYQRPYYRDILEQHHARMRHWDGGGGPAPHPDRFDYRTIQEDFDIWGWQVSVEREPVEFLNLVDASCQSVTARGSGSVAITVPARCQTGVDGQRTVVIDLGATQATDEPAGLGSSQVYGRTVTVALEPLHPCPSPNPNCS